MPRNVITVQDRGGQGVPSPIVGAPLPPVHAHIAAIKQITLEDEKATQGAPALAPAASGEPPRPQKPEAPKADPKA
jgi:hypothetical protein